LNGFSLDSLPAFLTDNPDSTVFFTNVPVSLAPSGQTGDSFNGALFGVNIDNNATAGPYSGSVTIQGGTGSTDLTGLVSQNIQVVVNQVGPSVSPEPGSEGLVLAGILAVCGFSIRKYRTTIL
jgi:hypothetical protein